MDKYTVFCPLSRDVLLSFTNSSYTLGTSSTVAKYVSVKHLKNKLQNMHHD